MCGAGCATFVKGELLLHAATSDDNLIPYSRYAWKGSADGRGLFCPRTLNGCATSITAELSQPRSNLPYLGGVRI